MGAIESLYLHVPFCFHKCHHCDFYSIVESPEGGDRQQDFVQRLIAELTWRAGQYELRPTTVFIGGGTPTLLRADLWRQLFAAFQRLGILERTEEFTVEANPETVTAELAEVLVSGGVNRTSIGAQSFHPALLKTLERWHEPASVAAAVKTLRSTGIANINLDLIFAIPGQTLDGLDADLDAALALRPDHLSCYGLTYEPGTAMTRRLRMGQIVPVTEEVEAAMYEHVMDRFEAAGFEHYEISNWARPGRRCRHNLAYWHNRNWLGIGPSAASHISGHRWKNQPHLGQYLSAPVEPPIVDDETLPPERRVGEHLMLGLRLREGLPQTDLQVLLPAGDPRWQTLGEFVSLGLLEYTATHLRLTRRGVLVADAVLAKLL